MVKFDIMTHRLVPKHEKASQDETKELFDGYVTQKEKLPRIKKEDPAIAHLDVKPGDVIKITRDSPTAGKTTYYRIVV